MRRRRNQQIEAEFAFHLEQAAAENRAAGMAAGEARRQAALALGSAERWKEEGREAQGLAWLASWGRDLALALRGLRRAPGFAAVAILTLALGIGANTAVFSMVAAVLLRPLPFAHADRLFYVWETAPGATRQSPLSYPDFLDLRRASDFSGMAAYALNDLTLTGRGAARHVRAAQVSANLFAVLGVRPGAGRGFLADEDQPGALAGADAAVLGHALAVETFGTAAAALGQPLTLEGRPYRVVGVMASGFQFPLDDHEDLWTTVAPLTISSAGPAMTAQRGVHWMEAVARLAPGAGAAAGQAQVAAAMAGLARRFPNDDSAGAATLVSIMAAYTGAARPALLALLAAVGCVLLLACVNVAGLLLARAARRRQEFALRAALGAGRGALLRQVGCESAVLGLLGAAAGVALATAAIHALAGLAPGDIVRLDQARLSPLVLAFALALGVGTTLLFGLLPALELARADHGGGLSATLQSGGRSLGAGAPRRWRRGLVTAQYGLAAVVLTSALVMVHSLDRLMRVEPGFSPAHVLAATLNLPDARYPGAAEDAAFFDRLIARLERQPGIAAVAAAMPMPLGGNNLSVSVNWPDHPLPPASQPSIRVSIITPGYFRALGIPLRRGRDFTAGDARGKPQVAVVNQAFVARYLGGRTVLGQRITPGISSFPGAAAPRTIVGVVNNTKMTSLAQPDPPIIYIPQDQVPLDGMNLLVRARPGGEALAAAALRRAVQDLDPDIPVFDLRPFSSLLARGVAPSRFDALLLGLFAGLALLLASVGLYAVMAQAVVQRRRELAIRLAMGAGRREVVSLVLREGMATAGLGIACGLLAAWGIGRAATGALQANLYATSALDPWAFAGTALLLLAVAGAAIALPARRAATADPVQALRLE